MRELRVRLLGGFRVRVGPRETAADAWRPRKARHLVELLALAPGHRLHRHRVRDALWPELPPGDGADRLQQALDEARRILAPDPAAPHHHLEHVEADDSLALRGAPLLVDVDAFESAALHARRSRDPAAYERAVAHYGGDLLPGDQYEQWAVERERALHAEYLALLVELGALREARADLDGAAAVLRRAVLADPLHEDASRALMRVDALAGRRLEVLSEYGRLAAALDGTPGRSGAPGPAARRLREQVRTGGDVRAELGGELWEHVGDLRLAAGDTVGAATAYGSALAAGVVDLPASPGVLTGRIADDTGLRAVRLHRKAATARLAGEAAGACPAGEAVTAAEPHLDAAGAALARTGGHPAETGRLLAVRADWLRVSGRAEEARHAAEAGLHLAQEHGTAEDVAAAREVLALAHHTLGSWREGLRSEVDGPTAAPDAPPAGFTALHHCLGQYELYGDGPGDGSGDGPADGIEEYARQLLDLAGARGARRAEAFAWCLLGEALLLHGHWDQAPGCLERSAHLAEEDAGGEEFGGHCAAPAWQRLAEYAAARGDSAEAAACLRRGLAAAEGSPLARHTVGRLWAAAALDAVERGEPGEAVRAVRAASVAAARRGECPTCTAPLHPVAAEACAALGDADGAAEYAGAAQRVAARAGSPAWRAMAQSALGSLASARGDAAGARALHLAAAGLYARARQPYWTARAQAQAVVAGGGVPGVAAEDHRLRAEAAAVFERLGARRALARIRAAQPAAGRGDGGGAGGAVRCRARTGGPGGPGGPGGVLLLPARPSPDRRTRRPRGDV